MEWVFLIIISLLIIASFLFVGFKKSFKIFFLSDERGKFLNGKIAKTGVTAILYGVYHYTIAMVAAATIVITLKSLGCSFLTIVFIMWIANALHGLVVLKVNDKSGIDLTLYAGTRRVVDALTTEKKILGVLSEIFFVAKLVFWDGPGELVIFLRSRITNRKWLVVIFLSAAGVQMIPWVMIYLKVA